MCPREQGHSNGQHAGPNLRDAGAKGLARQFAYANMLGEFSQRGLSSLAGAAYGTRDDEMSGPLFQYFQAMQRSVYGTERVEAALEPVSDDAGQQSRLGRKIGAKAREVARVEGLQSRRPPRGRGTLLSEARADLADLQADLAVLDYSQSA